jgi:hypothetical protein
MNRARLLYIDLFCGAGGTSTEEFGKFFGIDGSTVRKHLRKYRHDQQLTATNSVH